MGNYIDSKINTGNPVPQRYDFGFGVQGSGYSKMGSGFQVKGSKRKDFKVSLNGVWSLWGDC